MKVVVCGGSGFLGSHVADVLSEAGHEVTIYDRANSPHTRPGQRMVVGNIQDEDAVADALEGNEVIYHFAGLADIDEAGTRPLETVRENVLGTAVLLDAAVRQGIKRFVYASTVYVYSRLGGFYRASKQAAEFYIEEFQARHGLDYTILRFGTVYGPRADARNSIHRYLVQGLLDRRIHFSGSRDDIREYIHVRDAARLSLQMLAEAYRNQIVIISGHYPMKAVDLLRMIKEILNDEITIEFTTTPPGAHYTVTPYSFIPRVAHKLVSDRYMDLGQGLLECLHEIHATLPQATTTRQSDAP